MSDYISPSDPNLHYSGRIDFTNPDRPTLIWALSSVSATFRGTAVIARFVNHRQYWGNYMGYILDGKQGVFKLKDDDGEHCYEIARDLPDCEHYLTVFKRQDGCHYADFAGLVVEGAKPAVSRPSINAKRLKLEFFGDSITCGEISEAEQWAGQPDQDNDGEFSNAWLSYAAQTARLLGAEARLTAQGGIALLEGTGWFDAPKLTGMLQCWDKLRYNPQLGAPTPYDFDWAPDAAIVAIGQNDANPVNIMEGGTDNDAAVHWKNEYKRFINQLADRYPNALIVLKTTILRHHPNWDKAITEVCEDINNPRVKRFTYSSAAGDTPGHVRGSEAAKMAKELAPFLKRNLPV